MVYNVHSSRRYAGSSQKIALSIRETNVFFTIRIMWSGMHERLARVVATVRSEEVSAGVYEYSNLFPPQPEHKYQLGHQNS